MGRALGEIPQSARELQYGEIVHRLSLIERFFDDQELTPPEQAQLDGMGWIADSDADNFGQHPLLVSSRKALEENRHTGSEVEYIRRNRLTEWRVILGHAAMVASDDTGGENQIPDNTDKVA